MLRDILRVNRADLLLDMKTREVTINRRLETWAVCYVARRKGQRYWAASFYAPDHSLDWVKDWVSKQPNLKLSNEPSQDWQDSAKQYQAV